MMTTEAFWQWFESEMESRHLTYYGVERRVGLANGTLSKQGRNRSVPTLTACLAIAEELDLAAEEVLRRAGKLPPLPAPVAEEQEIVDLLRRMPPSLRAIALRLMHALAAADAPALQRRGYPTGHYTGRVRDPDSADYFQIYAEMSPEKRRRLIQKVDRMNRREDEEARITRLRQKPEQNVLFLDDGEEPEDSMPIVDREEPEESEPAPGAAGARQVPSEAEADGQ